MAKKQSKTRMHDHVLLRLYGALVKLDAAAAFEQHKRKPPGAKERSTLSEITKELEREYLERLNLARRYLRAICAAFKCKSLESIAHHAWELAGRTDAKLRKKQLKAALT